MKRRYNYRCYRHPRTQQEKRANQDSPYVRGKRLPSNLADLWDDCPIDSSKTWKNKRKHQYRTGKRGKSHDIVIEGRSRYSTLWELQEYFEKHDIPYRIEKLFKVTIQTLYYYTEYRQVGQQAILAPWAKTGIMWTPKYQRVIIPYDKPRKHKQSWLVGFKVTWWSNKDIGIDYVLKLRG